MTRFVPASDLVTAGITTLPGQYYTSPELFACEQERIFLRRWLCAGREEQLRGPGDYFVRTFGSESVIVVRGGDGRVRGLHNVCRHRGTRLCQQSSGHLGQTIRCPYHAWTYALDGRLIGAPAMDELPGFDRQHYPLKSAPVALWDGFVFLCFGEPDEPFTVSHQALVGKFTDYQLAALRCVRTIHYDVAANWKLIFENYSECYHCPTIHPALARLTPSDSGRNDLVSGPILGGYMELVADAGSLTRSGRACSRLVGNLSADDRRRVYYYSIFPNMLLSLHADYVMVHTLWPVSPGETHIECSWLFHPDAAEDSGFAPDEGIDFWDMTNRQDWQICELSQLGVASRAYTPGPYAPRDGISAAFDRYYLEVMSSE